MSDAHLNDSKIVILNSNRQIAKDFMMRTKILVFKLKT